ncbi:hypothetical protein SETIT_8G159300v2, partial [Setaria italica]
MPRRLLDVSIPFCYFPGSLPHRTTPSTGAPPPPPSCVVPPCAPPSSKCLTPCWCAPWPKKKPYQNHGKWIIDCLGPISSTRQWRGMDRSPSHSFLPLSTRPQGDKAVLNEWYTCIEWFTLNEMSQHRKMVQAKQVPFLFICSVIHASICLLVWNGMGSYKI